MLKIKLKDPEIILLGEFDITTGNVVVSDPCYDLDPSDNNTVHLTNVKLGKWNSSIIKCDSGWGGRPAILIAHHEKVEWNYNYNNKFSKDYNKILVTDSISNKTLVISKLDTYISVDSGQAGIFDLINYKVDYKEPYQKIGEQEYTLNGIEYNRQQYIKKLELTNETSRDSSYKVFLETQLESLKEEALDIPIESTTDWYDICCDKTLSNTSAGAIIGGCVSSSGYGDGGYKAFAAKNKDKEIVFIAIMFINGLED